ncbi:FIST N-terminal domain-containing protein [Lachnospiraceae bacterium 46-61]
MAIRTLSIKGINSHDMAQQAKIALKDFNTELLLFFASSFYDTSSPAKELSAVFPNSRIIGSTSHSEYCNSNYTNNSVSIMAIDKQSVEDVCIEVIENIEQKNYNLHHLMQQMETQFGGQEEIFNHFDRYVGIVLFESSAKAEEVFMDSLGTASDILFVGGSSSFTENNISKVYVDDKSYTKAAVLAILKTVNGYDVLKTQSACILSKRTLLVTKSNMHNRILYEFDHRPCDEVYAEVLNVPKNQIQNYFVSNPLGIVADGEIFVRTFDQIQEDGITLHCGLPEGSEINVLKIGDIVSDTQKALDNAITYLPAGVINFNCLYRTFEMLNKNLTEHYCSLFGRYNSIGFSTSGEAFLGHINETSTILIIK